MSVCVSVALNVVNSLSKSPENCSSLIRLGLEATVLVSRLAEYKVPAEALIKPCVLTVSHVRHVMAIEQNEQVTEECL